MICLPTMAKTPAPPLTIIFLFCVFVCFFFLEPRVTHSELMKTQIYISNSHNIENEQTLTLDRLVFVCFNDELI